MAKLTKVVVKTIPYISKKFKIPVQFYQTWKPLLILFVIQTYFCANHIWHTIYNMSSQYVYEISYFVQMFTWLISFAISLI